MKLRWNWMTDNNNRRVLTSTGTRWVAGIIFGVILLLTVGTVLDLATPLPDWAWITITEFVPVLYVLFGKHLIKLHYLHGLGYSQSKAIKFYDELSKPEKAQLPKDFESVIRDNEGSVAERMLREADSLIHEYWEKERMNMVAHTDDRIEAQLQVMRERRAAFRQEIDEEMETRKIIERMP